MARIFSFTTQLNVIKSSGVLILNTITNTKSFKYQRFTVCLPFSTMSKYVNKVSPSQVKSGKASFPLIVPLACPIVAHCSASNRDFPKLFTEKELRSKLTNQQYSVTQNSGTERAFTGEYWDNHRKGIYKCVVCDENLFSSDAKFESGSGWPSFNDVLVQGKVKLISDNSMLMSRTEVLCAQCGSHLGHVFNDGPAPNGKRYCMNSASLNFKEHTEDL